MPASTTKRTHWSDFVEPSQAAPEGATDGLLTFAKRDPAWVAEMVPLFPITSFVRDSSCSHQGPVKTGSFFVCMICYQSGMDHHPALQRSPLTDPKPEPEPTSKPLTPDKPKDGSRKSEQWAPYASKKPNAA